MKASRSKSGVVRIVRVTVLSLIILCAVISGVRMHQALFQDQSSDEDYD